MLFCAHYLAEVAAAVRDLPSRAAWAPYLRARLLVGATPALPLAFSRALDRLTGASAAAAATGPGRWSLCVGSVTGALPALTDLLFISKYYR